MDAKFAQTKKYLLCSVGITYLVKNFTRVYRTETIPGYEIAKKYKLFRDTHIAYYVLQNGKGYYFHRIFGNCNKHSGGIFGGLSVQKQIEISGKVFEEIYCETRNYQIKNHFLLYVQNHVKFYLKNEEQCTDFYKEFIKKFPELSADIENIISQKKLSEESP
jgi:hypothetical protein